MRSTTVSAITGKPWFWPAVLAALALVTVVPGLGSHGFWEPEEISVADRAQQLVAAAADDGEAAADEDSEPATWDERAAAASIAALGPGELAARLPMALFGLIAVAAAGALGWRLAGARAGLFAAAALLSFPLFVFPSRLLIGDIAGVAAYALIALGAAGLCWPPGPREGPARLRHAGDLALLAAGAWLGHAALGTLLGATAPLAAAAVAGWLALFGDRRQRREGADGDPAPRSLTTGTILLSAATGLTALWVIAGAYDVATAYPGDRAVFGMTLIPAQGDLAALGGAWRESPDLEATFDVLFEPLAYGMFPWSVLAPIALVMPALSRRAGRRAFGAYLCLAQVAAAWAAATFLFRAVGPVHVPALAAAAVAIGALLDDALRARDDAESAGGARELPLVAVMVVLATAVLAKDLLAFPEQLAAVHLAGETVDVPEALRMHVAAVAIVGVVFALVVALGLLGFEPKPESRLAWLRGPIRRALPAAAAISLVYALLLAHGFIPALSQQYSSKGLFDALSSTRQPGERLVILGSPGPGHDLYARGELETVSSRSELIDFLGEPERAFALIRRNRLCPVQQSASSADVSYHVLYDRNAEFLLLTNQLRDGETDLNPLRRMMLREPPEAIDTPFDATFDDRVRLVGYNMPERVSRGETFEVTLYYEVLAPISRNWKVFVHFDRGGSRFNGDHEPAEGVCGTRYWQAGDVVVDRFEVTAGGAGHPRGEHQVWTGFFVGSRGNWTNMSVSDAPDADDQDRVRIGTIRVE